MAEKPWPVPGFGEEDDLSKRKQKIDGLEIFAVERVEQAVEYCRE